MYRHLADLGVPMTAKPFAMGFRVEHPQALLNTIQYGQRDAQGAIGDVIRENTMKKERRKREERRKYMLTCV